MKSLILAERFEMEIGMGSCGSALNIDNENNMIILQVIKPLEGFQINARWRFEPITERPHSANIKFCIS